MLTPKMILDFNGFSRLLDIADFDLLITFSIGSRHIIHQEIKEKYDENKEYYYEFFKNSPYYKDLRLSSLSVDNYRAIQQYIGIYLHERSQDKNDFTMKLIKKGFRYVFNFINNKKHVDFYELRDGFLEYVRKNNLDKTIQSAHLFGIGLYLCREQNKTIIFDEFDVNLIKNSLKQIFSIKKIEPEISHESGEYLKQYQVLNKRGFQLPLNNLITIINDVQKQKIASENNLDFDRDSELLNSLIREAPFYKSLTKIGLVLQYCNIDPIDLQNITSINYSTLREILTLCFDVQEMLGTTEDLSSLLGSYLAIYALANDYNVTKHNFIITAQEETQHKLLQLKNEYEHKIRSLEKVEDDRTAYILKMEETNSTLQETVNDLERQLKKKDIAIEELNKKMERLEAQQSELNQLINQSPSTLEAELTEDEMAAYINQYKCVVIGGMNSWQEHLKSYVPTCRFLNSNDLNLDLSFLLHADLVFFNESINNHSMYNKVKSMLENTQIPLCYSGVNTNVKISLKKMYDQLKGLSKGGEND